MRTNEGTSIEALMELLIENGTEEMASVFAGLFNLAMRIARERFLGTRCSWLGLGRFKRRCPPR
jgi:hypothetical protein